MGWTVHYQYLRDTPLTPEEIATIAALNLEAATSRWDGSPFHVEVAPAARHDRVLAEGYTKLPMGDSDDAEALDLMILRLLELVPGAELRLSDDFEAFGWAPGNQGVSGGPRTPRPVDVENGTLVDPKTLAPPAPPPLPAPVTALVDAVTAGQEIGADEFDESAVTALLAALPATEHDDPRRPTVLSLLARARPDLVVQVGLDHYAGLASCYDAREAIRHALDVVERPVDFAEAFLDVWRNPTGIYHYGDLPTTERFLDAVAPLPVVVAQLIADVEAFETGPQDDDIGGRRAEHAVQLLACGRTDAGLRALVGLIARWRDRPQAWRFELGVFDHAHEHLAIHGDVRVFATLLHFLGTMAKDHRGHRAALTALVRLDPGRARPHVFAIADLGAMTSSVVDALAALGDPASLARLRVLARHPSRSVWFGARRALEAAGIDPGPEPTPPPPEELVVHPDVQLRHDALRELHDRKDLALMLSLCAAEAVDALLRARTDSPGLPFSWHEWDELLPLQVRNMRTDIRLRWALGEGAASLGPQVRWPAIEPILADGAEAVAATIPSQLFRLPPEVLADLRAEEASMLAAL